MSFVETAKSLAAVKKSGREPVGKIHVVDPSALNWLFITYNTVEELIRVDHQGNMQPAAMRHFEWVNDRTLQVQLREDEEFPDGEPLSAEGVQRSFCEVMRWRAPHPPGTQFNLDPRTTFEITGRHSFRLHFPEPDGLAMGKLRAMHLMSTRFWDEIGFGYARNGSGEGHW
jgi:ABC-type transport system substrate-binding protein